MKEDKIEIEILPDGTLKVTTDKVSMPNHVNAEGFLRAMSTACGGVVKRVRRIGMDLRNALHQHASDGHTHDHDHGHTH